MLLLRKAMAKSVYVLVWGRSVLSMEPWIDRLLLGHWYCEAVVVDILNRCLRTARCRPEKAESDADSPKMILTSCHSKSRRVQCRWDPTQLAARKWCVGEGLVMEWKGTTAKH